MALEDILKKIREEAQKQSAQIIADAEKEKADLLAKVQEKIREFNRNAKISIEKQVENVKRQILVPARQQAKNIILEKKQKQLEDFFSRMFDGYFQMDKKTYEKSITNLSKSLPKSEKTKALLAKSIENFSASNKTSAGFILSDGKINYDLRFDSIFKEIRETSGNKISQILFA